MVSVPGLCLLMLPQFPFVSAVEGKRCLRPLGLVLLSALLSQALATACGICVLHGAGIQMGHKGEGLAVEAMAHVI